MYASLSTQLPRLHAGLSQDLRPMEGVSGTAENRLAEEEGLYVFFRAWLKQYNKNTTKKVENFGALLYIYNIEIAFWGGDAFDGSQS